MLNHGNKLYHVPISTILHYVSIRKSDLQDQTESIRTFMKTKPITPSTLLNSDTETSTTEAEKNNIQ